MPAEQALHPPLIISQATRLRVLGRTFSASGEAGSGSRPRGRLSPYLLDKSRI